MLVPKFTEEYRRELWENGRKSFYFFNKGLLGMPDLADMHRRLCDNLQGCGDWNPRWSRGAVVAFRSSLKSSLASIGYPLWKGLYQINHSTRLIGSSFDNAKLNFLEKAQAFFRDSRQASLLQWVYAERLPSSFDGWNESQLVFLRDDPFALPAITIKGVNADQEGAHVHLVVIDDPEGAEAEKSPSVQTDARRAVATAVPLLISPENQILVVCTPHGADPLAYRLAYENLDPKVVPVGDIKWDNTERTWQIFWVPIIDGAGNPAWPERFNKEQIDSLRKSTDPATFQQQYLLLRTTSGAGWFNRDTVKENLAKWSVPGRVISYTAMMLNKDKWYNKGEVELSFESRKVDVSDLRFYAHYDPLHKEDAKPREHRSKRPARAAVVCVGVAPDGHAFCMGYWQGNVAVEEQLRQLYGMHAKYGLFKATIDPIGAQNWALDILKILERTNPSYQKLRGSAVFADGRALPRLSAILEEDKRTTKFGKESVIFERLEPWITLRTLHFFEDQHEMLTQVFGFPNETDYLDLIDALAQGPAVWQPGMKSDTYDRMRRRDNLLRSIAEKHTGYISPHEHAPAPARTIHPDLQALVSTKS